MWIGSSEWRACGTGKTSEEAVYLVGGFVWLFLFFASTNHSNVTNQINQRDQTNQIDQLRRAFLASRALFTCSPRSSEASQVDDLAPRFLSLCRSPTRGAFIRWRSLRYGDIEPAGHTKYGLDAIFTPINQSWPLDACRSAFDHAMNASKLDCKP